MPAPRYRYLKVLLIVAMAVLWLSGASIAAEYKAEKREQAPPKDQLAPAIADTLQPEAMAVVDEDGNALCEIWLCKQWQVKPDFKPTLQLMYPFRQGELVGVIRYPRRGYDFRDQEISRGVYTLRYALQPVDGNHVGTSPTRDFFLLLPGDQDKSVEPIATDRVVEQSTAVSETSHPALLALQEARPVEGELPAMRQDDFTGWSILQFAGQTQEEGDAGKLRVDLVVEGFAAE